MTTQTAGGVLVNQMPSVNLLPPEIAEAAKFRRMQAGMGAVVLAAAAVVGLMYAGAHHSVSAAQNNVDAAQAQQSSLQSQVAALQSVSGVYSQVAAQKALLSQAMGSEVRWSYYLEDLSLRIPSGVYLTNLSVSQTGAAAATSTTPSALAPADQIGSISFTGVALSHDDVAKWLNAIAAEHGWSDPYVTSITETQIGSTNVYDWTGTVDVTSAALSNRYTESGS